MFLHMFVSHSVHGGGGECILLECILVCSCNGVPNSLTESDFCYKFCHYTKTILWMTSNLLCALCHHHCTHPQIFLPPPRTLVRSYSQLSMLTATTTNNSWLHRIIPLDLKDFKIEMCFRWFWTDPTTFPRHLFSQTDTFAVSNVATFCIRNPCCISKKVY